MDNLRGMRWTSRVLQLGLPCPRRSESVPLGRSTLTRMQEGKRGDRPAGHGWLASAPASLTALMMVAGILILVFPGAASRGAGSDGRPSAGADPPFSFGKLKRDKRLGTGELPVILPGPGYLKLRGKGVVPSTGGALVGPGTSVPQVSEFIKARGPKKRVLNQVGRVRLTARVTYTPQNGTPSTRSRGLTLIKRR
jgi:hypothetical protein